MVEFLKKINTVTVYTALLIAVGAYYLFTRLFLYGKYGPVAFGYDTGIYRHIISGYAERLGDPSLPRFGFAALSSMVHRLGASTDEILFGGYIIIAIAIALLLYRVVMVYTSKNAALIALFLFATSLVQFQFFWWFYYRNFLALFFILLSFLLFRYRSVLLVFPLVAIGIIHPVSLIPLGMTLILLCVADKENRRFLLTTGVTAIAIILVSNWPELYGYLALFIDRSGVAGGGVFATQQLHDGQFISAPFFILGMLPIVPFAIVGMVRSWRSLLPFFIFLISTLLLFFLRVPLYNRLFVFIDVVVIIFAAIALEQLIGEIKLRRSVLMIMIVYGLFLVTISTRAVLWKQPLITPEELTAIQSLEKEKNGYIMVLTSHYAPWTYGFSTKPVIAPGMFEHNLWNEAQWNVFWSALPKEERRAMLELYQRPGMETIYLFVGGRDLPFVQLWQDDPRFEYVNSYIWKFDL